MNLKSCEKKENGEADIIVEVNAEMFEAAIAKSFIKNRNSVAVPGFRKGKAPRKIIERMYGASIFHPDALDFLAPDVIDFVKAESELKIVGFPRISDVDIKENNSGVDLTVTVSVYPEVKLAEYKGLSAVKIDAAIPESAIDAEIAGVRLRNARIEKVDRPAISGDITVIDFEGFIDGVPFDGGKGENYELELGSGSFIPGFEDKVAGMTVGEERDIDLVFPEQYAENLAGKPVVFKVKLNELKEKQLPELDDEFAKDVSEFDTLEEYKADIRGRLQKEKTEESDTAFENALIIKITESMEAAIPEDMIEEQMDIAANNFARQVSAYGMEPAKYLQMMNMTPELFRENLRINSEKQVKATLALEKIAELEGIELSEEDIENEYKELSERFGIEPDKLKEQVDKEKVTQELKTRRAAKIVTDHAIAEAPSETDGEKPEKPVAKPKKAAAKKPAAEGETATEKPKKTAAKKPKGDESE